MLRRLRIKNLVLIRDAELELDEGLTALTGETGAGKTIFAQAIGLLLGSRGDASFVGADSTEAYVEAELEVPEGFWDTDELAALADLRPEDETGLVAARRVFADGRTRAYVWGRSVSRDDLAAAVERLIAMSGQFEQRRLARPAFQLDTLDAFVGGAQRERRRAAVEAWRAVTTARRRLAELERDEGALRARIGELRALVEDTEGIEPGEEDDLRRERERIKRLGDLVDGAAAAVAALDPDDGDGAAALASAAERAVAELVPLAPELGGTADELREAVVRLREASSELQSFLASLDADSARAEFVEARLDQLASLRRRYGTTSLEGLLERRAAAEVELPEVDLDDPLGAARTAVASAEAAYGACAEALHVARVEASSDFAKAVAAELRDVGMGEGEFVVEVREQDAGPAGHDEIVFLVRPNAGLPFGAVAETASGGELSRIALALAAVAGGETIVFDEVDAGIGGVTAHKVADVLRRLGERAQVLTITHLPQIASVADRHFRVDKVPGDPTHTRIEPLGELERREELERMLGGGDFVSTVTGRST